MTRDNERLDSWKAIAAYLGRDERTVRRWEREKGLPVRRVAGERGASVFAFTEEIDAWLSSAQPVNGHADPPADVAQRRWRWWAGAAAMLAITAAVVLFTARRRPDLRIELTPTALIAFDGAGAERWRHPFPGERVEVPGERLRHPVEFLPGRSHAIVTATQWRITAPGEVVKGGQVLRLSTSGVVERALALDDRLTFGATTYGPEWGITDFRVEPGGNRIAVAAHHHQWWPSVVTVMDERLNRLGTFVNAGWAERVHWVDRDRLLIAGFNEEHDGGMLALLDTGRLNGQSPSAASSRFSCTSCGTDRPLRYLVLARSEINRVTGSRFNRSRLEVFEGRIVARTLEATLSADSVADAIYEFTPALDLVRTSFSERYWELHRRLEAEGKLGHDREACPDRDGPRGILMWTSAEGWRPVTRPR